MSGYEKVRTADFENGNDADHVSNENTHSRSRNISPWVWCGISTTIAVLAVCTAIIQRNQLLRNLPTDFASAPHIPYVEKYFYNYYDFNPENHRLEFNDTGVDVLYAGHPEKKIDDAWNELLTDNYMELTKREKAIVEKASPWDLEELEGSVYMEVGVFHNLHCLDLIRRALEPNDYDIHTDFTAQIPKQWGRVHVYHCIDQLRQAIQCHSDLTPVPMFTIDGLTNVYATHGLSHTCRDFDAVVRWRNERNKERAPYNWTVWTG